MYLDTFKYNKILTLYVYTKVTINNNNLEWYR